MGNATFLYKITDGKLDAKVFDSDALPGLPWVDSPAKCIGQATGYVHPTKTEAEEYIQAKFETREELVVECVRRQISVDGRWGIAKLREVLGLEPYGNG